MQLPSQIRTLALLAFFSVAFKLAAQSAPLATFSCTEYADRDWPETLVGYDVTFPKGKAWPGKVRLVDGEGVGKICQIAAVQSHPDGSIRSCRVHFYAKLAAGGSYIYRLEAGSPVKPSGGESVQVKRVGNQLQVLSPLLGVELPGVTEKSFAKPVDAREVPAPILKFRIGKGAWLGQGCLQAKRQVTSYSQKVVSAGPLFHETAYRLGFAPEGYYTMRVRVERDLPLVHIAEEFDMGAVLENENHFVLNLSRGHKPQDAIWTSYAKPQPATQLCRKNSFHGVGTWTQPLDFSKPVAHKRLSAFQDFGHRAVWYGITGRKEGAPYVGFMSQNSGAWRLDMPAQGDVLWTKDKAVELRLPLNPYIHAEPLNPFSTAEIDPDLPPTLGRRHWALVLEPRPMAEDGSFDPKPHYHYRIYHGSMNLDHYKEWILDWPDRKAAYPRLLDSGGSLGLLKANLDRCPGKEKLASHYLVSGDPEHARRVVARALQKGAHRTNGFNCYVPHFRQIQEDMEFLFLADTVLAWPDLPAETRKTLRAKMAMVAYMLTNADFLPRGAGVHLGNPNMAINRTLGICLYGRMLPDHPMAKRWLDDANDYLRWSISHDVTPAGGQFRECPGYATYGPTVFLAVAARAIKDAGYDIDEFGPLKDMGQWFIDIATPPTSPRGWQIKRNKATYEAHIQGRKMRVLPGFGNGRDIPGGQTAMMLAGIFAQSDPAFASRLMGAFKEAGGFLGTEATRTEMWFYWDPGIQPKDPGYRDNVLTGLGGVLRSNPGAEETYACLRQGYVQSHWTPDQGTFVLYSLGQCLAPATGWTYDPTPEGMARDSQVAFGERIPWHEHGRVDTFIRDYGSTPSVGYLGGVQTYRRSQRQLLDEPFDWHRQVLMVRSPDVRGPNYVLLRDTAVGNNLPRTWWHQWLQTKAESVKPITNGLRASFPDGVMLDLLFLHRNGVKAEVNSGSFREYPGEDYCQVTIDAKPGEDYFVLFYPYKAGRPGLKSTELVAPGLARIVTPESEDYVFAAVEKPVTWAGKQVQIDGYAGMVRIKGGKAEMVNAASLPATLGYGNSRQSGVGPWEAVGKGSSVQVVASPPVRHKLAKPSGSNVIPVGLGKASVDTKAFGEGITGWVGVDGDSVTLVASEGLGSIGYGDFHVEGEAPFTCIWKPGEVTLEAKGRRRVFVMPIPENLVPANQLPPKDSLPDFIQTGLTEHGYLNWPVAPSMEINGALVQGGWFDGVMAVGLDDQQSKVVIRPWTNPSVWRENASTRLLPVE